MVREMAEREDEDVSRPLKRWNKENGLIKRTFNIPSKLTQKA